MKSQNDSLKVVVVLEFVIIMILGWTSIFLQQDLQNALRPKPAIGTVLIRPEVGYLNGLLVVPSTSGKAIQISDDSYGYVVPAGEIQLNVYRDKKLIAMVTI